MGTIVAAALAGAATDRPVQRVGGGHVAAGKLNQKVNKHIFMDGVAGGDFRKRCPACLAR